MGTLYDQPPRDHHHVTGEQVAATLRFCKQLAHDEEVALADVITIAAVMERTRSNNLYAQNGDCHDEQIAGIGQELANIGAQMEAVSGALSRLSAAILPICQPGKDASGGTVDSVTEALMGVTGGLVQIAEAVEEVARNFSAD